MKKSIIYLLVVIITGGGLVGWWSYQRYFKVEEPKIVKMAVERGDIDEVVRVRGELAADEEYNLGWSMAGVVEEVNVEVGDRVEAGQQLARLDTVFATYDSLKKRAVYETGREQARLDKTAAEKDLKSVLAVNASKKNQARGKVLDAKQYLEETRLYWQGVSVNYIEGDITYDQAKQTLVAAENSYREAQDAYALAQRQADQAEENARQSLSTANLTGLKEGDQLASGTVAYNRADMLQAKDKIDKSVLRAPVGGTVTKVDAREGEVVSLGQSVVVIMSEVLIAEAEVSELEISRIKVGSEVNMKLEALPEGKWGGQVAEVEPRSREEDGDKFYQVKIALNFGDDEWQELMRSGMSADLVIKIKTWAGVLKIPEFYVEKNAGREYVLVVEDEEVRETDIVTGASDGEFIEVLEGLAAGQVVGILAD